MQKLQTKNKNLKSYFRTSKLEKFNFNPELSVRVFLQSLVVYCDSSSSACVFSLRVLVWVSVLVFPGTRPTLSRSIRAAATAIKITSFVRRWTQQGARCPPAVGLTTNDVIQMTTTTRPKSIFLWSRSTSCGYNQRATKGHYWRRSLEFETCVELTVDDSQIIQR